MDSYQNLKELAKQVDRKYTNLRKLINGEKVPAAPMSHLDELKKEAINLMDDIKKETEWQRKHNDNIEKMLNMLTATVEVKKQQLQAIEEKMSQYIIKPKVTETIEQSNSQSKTSTSLLKSMENIPASPPPATPKLDETYVADERTTPHNLPVASNSSAGKISAVTPEPQPTEKREVTTPKLTDYLELGEIYKILDGKQPFSSKKKSLGKGLIKSLSTPDLSGKSRESLLKSAMKSRRQLMLTTTPGKTGAPQCNNDAVSTPVMPQLDDCHTIELKPLPKRDFTGRIAEVDALEFHATINKHQYFKKLVSLEMVNKSIQSLDDMYRMSNPPNQPMNKQELVKLIMPMAVVSQRADLIIGLLQKLNRLINRGNDLYYPILG